MKRGRRGSSTVVVAVALLLVSLATVSCGDSSVPVSVANAPGGPADAYPTVTVPRSAAAVGLDATLATLVERAHERIPEGQFAVAVLPLATNELSTIEPDQLFKSASAAKAWWTAAALNATEVSQVQPYARETFKNSSDIAAAKMIDLAGGPDAVNDFTRAWVGMHDSGLVRWVGNGVEVGTNVEARLEDSNYTTARDMITFLAHLERREILDETATASLLDWMRLSPRTGAQESFGGRLPEQLPKDVQPRVAHKAGWLLPKGGDAFTLVDFGLVYPRKGEPYAIALLGVATEHYRLLKEFFSYASCVVYREVAADTAWKCNEI